MQFNIIACGFILRFIDIAASGTENHLPSEATPADFSRGRPMRCQTLKEHLKALPYYFR